ncbi:MAG: hypothetical protein HY713_13395 [candidate division NC10 bacterium]|nr:hypothetical protein [candidate division NC10 bacterium]
MPRKREEEKAVRLSITVDEATWRELRDAAERERESRGRASINALVQRLIKEYLARRERK